MKSKQVRLADGWADYGDTVYFIPDLTFDGRRKVLEFSMEVGEDGEGSAALIIKGDDAVYIRMKPGALGDRVYADRRRAEMTLRLMR
jgi:hypothetical protein